MPFVYYIGFVFYSSWLIEFERSVIFCKSSFNETTYFSLSTFKFKGPICSYYDRAHL